MQKINSLVYRSDYFSLFPSYARDRIQCLLVLHHVISGFYWPWSADKAISLMKCFPEPIRIELLSARCIATEATSSLNSLTLTLWWQRRAEVHHYYTSNCGIHFHCDRWAQGCCRHQRTVLSQLGFNPVNFSNLTQALLAQNQLRLPLKLCVRAQCCPARVAWSIS